MLDARTDLRGMLKDAALLETRGYVAGAWVQADDGATFDVVNPARGDTIGRPARPRSGPISCAAGMN